MCGPFLCPRHQGLWSLRRPFVAFMVGIEKLQSWEAGNQEKRNGEINSRQLATFPTVDNCRELNASVFFL
jgi:hypothetical protein